MRKFTLLLLISTLQLSAQPGQFDLSFGTYGTALGPLTSVANISRYVIQQADGKLLATGYQFVNLNENMFVVRYNTDGSFDSNFGVNGVIEDSIGIENDHAMVVAQQSDGKIVVAGGVENSITFTRDIFIRRYDSTGVTDTTFGLAGISIIDIQNNSDEIPTDIKIQPDGKIVLCGSTASGLQSDVILLRYNTDGTLDTTFGNGGVVLTNVGVTSQSARSMALTSNGQIVIAGFTDDPSSGYDILVIRYNANGVPDNNFGTTGIFRMDIAHFDDELFSLALQADGNILAAGYTKDSSGVEDDLIIRLDSTGHIDSTFNITGMLIKDYNNTDNQINTLMIQNDGKIVTAGRQFITNYDISLSRYLSDGTEDHTFGIAGHITHPIGTEEETINLALLQHDEKIVATGFYTDGGLTNIFTSRFMNDSLQTFISKVNTNDFHLYPQPASTIIKLSEYPERSQYTISDVNGRIICSEKNVTPVIDISSFEPGVYLISFTSLEKKVVKKFIKIN